MHLLLANLVIWVTRCNFFTYAKYVAAEAEADATVSTQCAQFVARLKEGVEELDEAMHASKKAEQSDEITAECVQRMSYYRILRRMAETNLKAYAVERQEAARQICQVLTDNRFKENGNMDLITGALYNLLQDLEEKCPEALTEIGATGVVEDLKRSNDLVYRLVMERNADVSQRQIGAIAAARKKVTEAMNSLFVVVNGKAQEDSRFDSFIDFVNTYIERMRAQLHLRIRRNEDEEMEEVEEEIEEEEVEEEGSGEGGSGSEEGGGSGGESSVPGESVGGSGSGGESEQTWPVINPDDPTVYTGTLHQGSTYRTVTGTVGTPIEIPEPEEGMMWPTNMPSVMPACDFQAYTMPVDSDVTTLYKLEYKDGDTVLRTDYLPAGDIVFLYAAPDGKQWTNKPRYDKMPARDWTVYTKDE